MSRALCAFVAAAFLICGCASRRGVGRLESEVKRLRSELVATRMAQDATARDLARIATRAQALDTRTNDTQSRVRTLIDDVERLAKRTDAVEAALGETRARGAALTIPAATPTPPAERLRARPAPAPPARPAPRAGNPEQEYAAALATFRSREHGQAVLDFIDFIARHPKHPLAGNAQYWIGEAYWAQRDYRQALLEFEKVFRHGAGKAPDALVKIGLCYARLSDASRAQQTWQRVVREYPRSEAAITAQSLLRTHATSRR